MGRKKTFEESAVLQTAMLLFWKQGYDATTFAKLERATGIHGRSLIHCFGDKDSLFIKSLQAYLERVNSILDAHFSSRGIQAILSFFRDIETAPSDSPHHYGCLICNTIFDKDRTDPSVMGIVATFRRRLLVLFQRSLEADNIPNAAQRANFLLNQFWGNVTEIRRTGTTRSLAESNTVLADILTSWSRESLSDHNER
jgi:TetR/AcrR family transcriptional regulator, transcriptional repressor for nem operon